MCLKCEEKKLEQNSRRGFLKMSTYTLLASTIPSLKAEPIWPTKINSNISPDAALEQLIQGNKRYVQNKLQPSCLSSNPEFVSKNQTPYACILGCADSRISPELCFDAAQGDLFVTRVAGNYVSMPLLASLEYATIILNAPLIMVLGHSKCNAIKAAIQSVKTNIDFPGHIQTLTTNLSPAVRSAMKSKPKDLEKAAIRENIILNAQTLRDSSPILRKYVQKRELKVVGALYELTTGEVEIIST